jgi:hypothetical protein
VNGAKGSRAIARRDIHGAFAAMALAGAAAFLVLEVWRAHLNAPFGYRDDTVLNLMAVKSVLESVWYLENPSLGAPLGQKLYDYPVFSGDHLNLVIFKLLGLATSEPAAVLNLFYLLTFPLVALTAFVVMRTLRVSLGPAVVCSALYALLPYHFLRGETHVFLSAYYAVPLGAYLVLAILTGKPLFDRNSTRTGLLAFASRRTLATIGMCLVVAAASGSFYYSAFATLLIAAATALRFAATRSARALASGGAVAALIVALGAINLAPVLVYRLANGTNHVNDRQPFESEYYSLRLTQLLLPLDSHRFGPFADVRRTYDRWSDSTGVDITEAALASLGTIGALGLLGLLGSVLVGAVGAAERRPPHLVRAAGTAAVVALLIATIGGFSSFIGLVYPQLRAWNRLSVFIAFLAFVGVAVALDRLGALLASRRAGRMIFAGLLAFVFVLGALDQTSQKWVPSYDRVASEYASDRAFVRAIESRLPNDAAVFELPYAAFPEYTPPPPGRTVVYDFLRPYLHSNGIRWSFGAMQGRQADWASRLVDKPLRDVLPIVSALGFKGLYIDRFGYVDDAAADAAERELVQIVGRAPMRNADGRLLFFDLRDYNGRLRRQRSVEELASLRARVLPEQ